MRKKVYGFSESAAGEIGEVLNRYRAGFLGSPAPKSRHRENALRASTGLVLTVITTRPNGGYGPAFDATITLAADGNWTATGDDRAIIVPKQV